MKCNKCKCVDKCICKRIVLSGFCETCQKCNIDCIDCEYKCKPCKGCNKCHMICDHIEGKCFVTSKRNNRDIFDNDEEYNDYMTKKFYESQKCDCEGICNCVDIKDFVIETRKRGTIKTKTKTNDILKQFINGKECYFFEKLTKYDKAKSMITSTYIDKNKRNYNYYNSFLEYMKKGIWKENGEIKKSADFEVMSDNIHVYQKFKIVTKLDGEYNTIKYLNNIHNYMNKILNREIHREKMKVFYANTDIGMLLYVIYDDYIFKSETSRSIYLKILSELCKEEDSKKIISKMVGIYKDDYEFPLYGKYLKCYYNDDVNPWLEKYQRDNKQKELVFYDGLKWGSLNPMGNKIKIDMDELVLK